MKRIVTKIFDWTLSHRALLLILLVFVCLLVGWPTAQGPEIFTDSEGYLKLSSARPPVFSLIAHFIGTSYCLSMFQFVLSILSWCCLGYLLAGSLGILFFGCFALSAPISDWNQMILSESMSLSFLALSLSSIIVLLRRWTSLRFLWWVCALTLLGFTRVTNLFLLPFFALPFVFSGCKRFASTVVVVILLFFAGNYLASTKGASLQHMTITNVIMTRILPIQSERLFFSNHGMPDDEIVMQFSGKNHNRNVQALFAQSPEFASWMTNKGSAVYKRWLLTRWFTYVQAWSALDHNRGATNHQYAAGIGTRSFAKNLTFLYVKSGVPVMLWLATVIVAMLGYCLIYKVKCPTYLLIALVPATYIQAFIGFHGDAIEISRHLLMASVLYRLTFIVAVVSILEMSRKRLVNQQMLFDSREKFCLGVKLYGLSVLAVVTLMVVLNISSEVLQRLSPWGFRVTYFAKPNLTKRRWIQPHNMAMVDYGEKRPALFTPKDGFSSRWEGILLCPDSAEYGFYSKSDDGIRVYIDNELLIDNWRDQYWDNSGVPAKKYLQEGSHLICIEHYDNNGTSALRVRWIGGSLPANCIIGKPYVRKK